MAAAPVSMRCTKYDFGGRSDRQGRGEHGRTAGPILFADLFTNPRAIPTARQSRSCPSINAQRQRATATVWYDAPRHAWETSFTRKLTEEWDQNVVCCRRPAASGEAPGSVPVQRVWTKPAVDCIQGIVNGNMHHRVLEPKVMARRMNLQKNCVTNPKTLAISFSATRIRTC